MWSYRCWETSVRLAERSSVLKWMSESLLECEGQGLELDISRGHINSTGLIEGAVDTKIS